MRQMIFYAATEAELFDFAITEASLDDIRAKGFDSIYLEYRNTARCMTSSRMQTWLRRISRVAPEKGLRVVVDASMNLIDPEFRSVCPETYTDPLHHHRLRLDGNACVRIETPGTVEHWTPERAWVVEWLGETRCRLLQDVTDVLEQVEVVTEGGGCAMTQSPGRAETWRTLRVPGCEESDLVLVGRQRYKYGDRDLGHPVHLQWVERLLDRFEDVPCEGFVWDEPHHGYAFYFGDGRVVSDRLYDVFEKRFGTSLCDVLLHLWVDVEGEDAALTRYRYAELLETELSQLEDCFADRVNRRWDAPASTLEKRNRPFMGIHRTMHEELSDDFFIGSVDYFRHNRTLSAGFTDSVFERDDSMITFFHMSRSLMLDGDLDEAYSNNWGFNPTEAHHASYLPMMGAMNLRWIAHTYHHSGNFGPGYPHHPLWATLGTHLNAHRDMLDALENTKPDTDTAVLYTWPALATLPGNYLHVHRRNLMLLMKRFTHVSVQAQFLSLDAFASGSAVDSRLSTRAGTFKSLVLPWPDLLPPEAWTMLRRCVEAGVETLVFGPPAVRCTDGSGMADDFANLVGASAIATEPIAVTSGETLKLGDIAGTLSPTELQPNYHSNPANTYPDHFNAYAVQPADGAEACAWNGDTAIGLRRGALTYLACEAPHVTGWIEQMYGAAGTVRMPSGMIGFTHKRGDIPVLSGCSLAGNRRSGEVVWQGRSFDLQDASRFVLQMHVHDANVILCDGTIAVKDEPRK